MNDYCVTMYTEVSAFCNNRCSFCAMDRIKRKGFITEKVRTRVANLIEFNPDIKFKVYFHVVGEPLLFKYLEDYIQSLLFPNSELWVCTNGVLLTDERLHKLQKAGLKNIWFSIFYTDMENYKKYVCTDNFIKARENLCNLLSKNELFEKIHIVTFSHTMNGIEKHIQGKTNITVECPRIECEWDGQSMEKFICISVDGDVSYDWRDYNFEKSIGNICNVFNGNIINGYDELPRVQV